jgi:hypothetical protein
VNSISPGLKEVQMIDPSPCPVCKNLHRNFIEVLLDSPHPIERISLFYEIDVKDLEYHKTTCMERKDDSLAR